MPVDSVTDTGSTQAKVKAVESCVVNRPGLIYLAKAHTAWAVWGKHHALKAAASFPSWKSLVYYQVEYITLSPSGYSIYAVNFQTSYLDIINID